MEVILLTALLFLSYVGNRVFSKFCSNLIVGGSVASYALYFLYNGVVACGFFYVSGGFKLAVNLPTAIYSAVFAVIVMLSIVGLFAYKLADVASVTIITSVCGLIATSALGAFIFSESIELATVIRIIIMLIAIAFIFLDKRKQSRTQSEASKPKRRIQLFILVILAITVFDCAATLTTKFYAIDPNVTDENSFFFFTNVFLIIFALIAFVFDSVRHRDNFQDALKLLNPRKSIGLIGSTVCSNISSLVGILLIASIDVSVFSPLTAALGIIAGVIASLLFKEKLGIFSYLAALISCIAVVI